jgi:cytochrome P450
LDNARKALSRGQESWEANLPFTSTMHLTVSRANVKYVLVDNFKNYPKGEIWRSTFRDLLGDGIFNADGFNWKKQRKVASYEFSAKTLKTFMFDTFVKHADKITGLIGDR